MTTRTDKSVSFKLPEEVHKWLAETVAALGYPSLGSFAQAAVQEKLVREGQTPPVDMTPKPPGGPRPVESPTDGRTKRARKAKK